MKKMGSAEGGHDHLQRCQRARVQGAVRGKDSGPDETGRWSTFADYEMELHTFDTRRHGLPRRSTVRPEELMQKGVEVFIANIPCWTWPNGVVRGVLNMGLPNSAACPTMIPAPTGRWDFWGRVEH